MLDKEQAVRSTSGRRKEKWEIRSLVEHLEALEHTDLLSPVVTVAPTIPTPNPADRPRRLVSWLSIGFACACIAGGIVLLADMIDIRANEAAFSAALGLLRP